jgi:hypothetical protein
MIAGENIASIQGFDLQGSGGDREHETEEE